MCLPARKETGEPLRETISLLLTSILGGVGLVQGITLLQETIGTAGVETSIYSISFFCAYLSVWLRFIPGNVAHIRKLERWPRSTVDVWLSDVSFITLESIILVYMARPSVVDPEQFLWSLFILMFVDIAWLVSMIRGAGKTRPKPIYIWLYLNVPTAFVLGVSLLSPISMPEFAEYLGPKSFFGMIVIPVVLYIFAFVDIYKSAPAWFGRPRRRRPKPEHIDRYKKFMNEAIKEAKKAEDEKGIPIGAVLVLDDTIVAKGHNRRVQDNNPMAHAEIECLRNAGRKQSYKGTTLYATLMPCALCAGAIIQFGIERVVVGESRNFSGAQLLLESWGVPVIDLDLKECYEILGSFIESNPNVWKEDIGLL